MEIKHAFFALALGAGLAHAGISSTLILDDFDSDPNDDAGGVAAYTSLVFNNPYNQGSSVLLDTGLDTGSDIGAIVFNSGIGVEQSLFVEYNNNGAGLDLSMSALSLTGFEVGFAAVDQDFIVSIRLATYDQNGSEIGSAIWGANVSAGVDVTADLGLNGIVSTVGDFDLENIDEITLNFNISNNTTASLDFIATEFRAVVPPPGSVALLGLGGLVIARRGRD